MVKSILIDDTLIQEYGLYLEGRPPIPTTEQDIEYIEIRGRHGSLTKKYAFKDIEYPLSLFFYRDVSFKKAFRMAKLMLFNAKKLVFEDDNDVYYKIKSIAIETAENDIVRFGKFVVKFILKPFQYELENDPITITTQTTITNLGYHADPIIKVTCNGTGKLYINDQTVQIKNINGTITIDSEMKNAYRDESGIIENLNSHMIGDFPILEHGQNDISFDGDITKLEVTKNLRWL